MAQSSLFIMSVSGTETDMQKKGPYFKAKVIATKRCLQATSHRMRECDV